MPVLPSAGIVDEGEVDEVRQEGVELVEVGTDAAFTGWLACYWSNEKHMLALGICGNDHHTTGP